MGELTITTFLTLDGVMQAPGGDAEDPSGNFAYGGWVFPHFDEALGNVMDDIFAKVDAFLLGRKTYDIFAAHWPKVTDADETVATALNTLPKFVASRTQSTFDWANTSHVENVVEAVTDLKQQFANEIQVHGSGNLAQTLIKHNLVDEYRLLIFPVIIGTGKRLFGEGTIPATLSLSKSEITPSQVMVNFYRPVGGLETGSFALDE